MLKGRMKTELLKARATKIEKQAFQEAAELAGLPLSAWVRGTIAIERARIRTRGRGKADSVCSSKVYRKNMICSARIRSKLLSC